MITKILKNVVGDRSKDRAAELHRNLIRHEAQIGGTLFGPVPAGGRREFFCLDDRTWVWHEEWIDDSGKRQAKTTRYDIRSNGILKAQDGQPYRPVSLQEAKHLQQAARLYEQRVRSEMYSHL